MKKSFVKITLFSTLLAFFGAAQADFFAYQQWVHPKTGQTIHELHCKHLGHTKHDDIFKQQTAIPWLAQQLGNDTLVIVENHPAENTQLKNPLQGLASICSMQGVLCKDICVGDMGEEHPEIMKEITNYNDTPYLNDFYAKISQGLASTFLLKLGMPNVANINFFRLVENVLLTDARILHAFYTNKHRKNIIIATGTGHLVNINPHLIALGYVPTLSHVNGELHNLEGRLNTYKNYVINYLENTLTSAKNYADAFLYGMRRTITLVEEFEFEISRYPIDIREFFDHQFANQQKALEKEIKEKAATAAVQPLEDHVHDAGPGPDKNLKPASHGAGTTPLKLRSASATPSQGNSLSLQELRRDRLAPVPNKPAAAQEQTLSISLRDSHLDLTHIILEARAQAGKQIVQRSAIAATGIIGLAAAGYKYITSWL